MICVSGLVEGFESGLIKTSPAGCGKLDLTGFSDGVK